MFLLLEGFARQFQLGYLAGGDRQHLELDVQVVLVGFIQDEFHLAPDAHRHLYARRVVVAEIDNACGLLPGTYPVY